VVVQRGLKHPRQRRIQASPRPCRLHEVAPAKAGRGTEAMSLMRCGARPMAPCRSDVDVSGFRIPAISGSFEQGRSPSTPRGLCPPTDANHEIRAGRSAEERPAYDEKHSQQPVSRSAKPAFGGAILVRRCRDVVPNSGRDRYANVKALCRGGDARGHLRFRRCRAGQPNGN